MSEFETAEVRCLVEQRVEAIRAKDVRRCELLLATLRRLRSSEFLPEIPKWATLRHAISHEGEPPWNLHKTPNSRRRQESVFKSVCVFKISRN
jgi:hypothetical protein